jgi:hypothetical protein
MVDNHWPGVRDSSGVVDRAVDQGLERAVGADGVRQDLPSGRLCRYAASTMYTYFELE